jgi:spore germination protein PE
MSCRWSVVKDMKINSISQASVLQIGDNEQIKPVSKVLAVQRQMPDFAGKEGSFKQFDLFSREIPLPLTDNEPVSVEIDQSCSRIQVGCIFMYGVVAASVFQVGTNKKIEAEARIKHIRQFVTDTGIPAEAAAQQPEVKGSNLP